MQGNIPHSSATAGLGFLQAKWPIEIPPTKLTLLILPRSDAGIAISKHPAGEIAGQPLYAKPYRATNRVNLLDRGPVPAKSGT